MRGDADADVIGAGLAGLSCAHHLCERGAEVVLLEASDAVGGRVRTDRVEGFLLDRGFQVLLTSYLDAARLLDYAELDLRELYPGALVWADGQLYRAAGLSSGRFVCGDHRETASMQGVLASGRRAAQAVAEELRTTG